jgi:UDP:flavonoid glycosyltransferase YjiC (YdhE family)
LIYGIPSIPVPHVLDQLGFAMQLTKSGVATELLKAKDLSEESIINAINEMQREYDNKKRNAEDISEKIHMEGGVREAVRLIKEVI